MSPSRKARLCLSGLLCHARMFCSWCGFPDILAITCSFSFNRERPTTDEQGLPTSAPGCQAVFTAVPSWWDTPLVFLGGGWRGGFCPSCTYFPVLVLACPRKFPSQHRAWPHAGPYLLRDPLCSQSAASFFHCLSQFRTPLWRPEPKIMSFGLEVVNERRGFFPLQSLRGDFIGIARAISLALKSRLVWKWSL